jgi:hypothetical protein
MLCRGGKLQLEGPAADRKRCRAKTARPSSLVVRAADGEDGNRLLGDALDEVLDRADETRC